MSGKTFYREEIARVNVPTFHARFRDLWEVDWLVMVVWMQQPKLRTVFPQTPVKPAEKPNQAPLDTGRGPHCWVQLTPPSEKIHLLPETIKPFPPGLECVLL